MEAGLIVGIVFGVLGFFAIIFLLARLASPKSRGERGEARVAEVLQQYINEVGGYLINDVILPYGNRTTQIDHIVFAPSGVFVVETKNWGGWIYGKDEDEYWTQTIGINRIQKHQHYNPVKQNHVHVKAVKVHTKEYDKGKFYNVVVFSRNNTQHVNSDYVVCRDELLGYLRNIKEKRYTLSKLKAMYDRIYYYIEHPVSTHDQHVQNIRRDHPVV